MKATIIGSDFLQKNGAEKYLPLFDYIHAKYTDSTYDVSQKENIVCYKIP
jgi:hypothetical protein